MGPKVFQHHDDPSSHRAASHGRLFSFAKIYRVWPNLSSDTATPSNPTSRHEDTELAKKLLFIL